MRDVQRGRRNHTPGMYGHQLVYTCITDVQNPESARLSATNCASSECGIINWLCSSWQQDLTMLNPAFGAKQKMAVCGASAIWFCLPCSFSFKMFKPFCDKVEHVNLAINIIPCVTPKSLLSRLGSEMLPKYMNNQSQNSQQVLISACFLLGAQSRVALRERQWCDDCKLLAPISSHWRIRKSNARRGENDDNVLKVEHWFVAFIARFKNVRGTATGIFLPSAVIEKSKFRWRFHQKWTFYQTNVPLLLSIVVNGRENRESCLCLKYCQQHAGWRQLLFKCQRLQAG